MTPDTKPEPFKTFYPSSAKNKLLSGTLYRNPETGEGFYIDKEEFLQNTAKSPFIKSIRDPNKYYF